MKVRTETEFCSQCVGTGMEFEGFEWETCTECGGTGHWDARTQLPVDGPCDAPGCAACSDWDRFAVAWQRLKDALLEATGIRRLVDWISRRVGS